MLESVTSILSSSELQLVGTAGALIWAALYLVRYGQRGPLLPPGPPTRPIVGNLLMLPKASPHLRFTEWALEYGGIYSLKLAGQTYVILTSFEAIQNIMDKQSAASSDRPPIRIRDYVEGQNNNLGLSRYTPRWKSLRRAAQQVVSQQACQHHLSIQQAEGVQLIYDLFREPERLHEHLRRVTTSTILAVMFGARSPSSTTPMFVKFWDMLEKTTYIDAPTSHPPIDIFPILEYIPERWATWKTKCRELKELQKKVLGEMLDMVKDRLDKGVGNESFMEEVYKRAEEWGLDEAAVLPFGFIMTTAGADTGAIFLQNFILFLTAFPNVQRQLQDEMDKVVGSERMPELGDFEHLPYLQAVINETHRLRPVAPLSVPHAASEDIRYQDYILPKGTVIFQNTWGLFHDSSIFKNPDTFEPERFIKDPSLSKYIDYVWGSGRRHCVGIHLAQNSLRINTMNLVWSFILSEALDEAGNKIPISLDNHTKEGLVQRPENFRVSIKPRTAHHEQIFRQAMKDSAEAVRAFEYDLEPEDRLFAEKLRAGA